MASTAPELDTATAVLAAVRSDRPIADAAEARILHPAVDWAAMHSVDSLDDAACDWYGNQPIPVSGPGAPLVAEFSIAEFAVALGLSTETGKAYIGEAVELRHRLPRTWARVVAGDLPAWRARRIAQRTIALSREAAAYVDKATAPFAHKTRPAELERTITTAIARYMPAEAEARRQAAADGRRFEIDPRHHDLNGLSGTADVYGTLDLADALDLEAAVAGTAATLKDLGSQDSLDVRRAAAVGEIARRQLALDLTGNDDDETGSTSTTAGRPIGDPQRAPLPRRRHRRRRDRAPRQPQPRRPRATDPLLVRDRREDRRETRHRPRPLRPRRPPRPTRRPWPTRSTSATGTASSPGAPAPPGSATRTTSCPTSPATRPAPATSHPSAAGTTGTRPTADGATSSSNPACTSGPAPTATSTSSTSTAPTTSHPTDERSRHGRSATYSTNEGRTPADEPAPPDE